MEALQRRQELMDAATELTKALKDVYRLGQQLAANMIAEGDMLLPAAATEKEQGRQPAKKVTYDSPVVAAIAPHAVDNAPKTATKTGRACSLCGEPGHRAPSCPNAHKIQAAKKAKVSKRDEVAQRREELRKSGKRGCGICARTGHRAANCPDKE